MPNDIHRRKLFGGRTSAEAVHAHLGFSPKAKCPCGVRPTTRCIILAPFDEAKRMVPDLELLVETSPMQVMEALVQIKESPAGPAKPYLRISVTYACKQHRAVLERAAAKLPSWCIAEFNHGPGPDRIVVGVN